MYTAV